MYDPRKIYDYVLYSLLAASIRCSIIDFFLLPLSFGLIATRFVDWILEKTQKLLRSKTAKPGDTEADIVREASQALHVPFLLFVSVYPAALPLHLQRMLSLSPLDRHVIPTFCFYMLSAPCLLIAQITDTRASQQVG